MIFPLYRGKKFAVISIFPRAKQPSRQMRHCVAFSSRAMYHVKQTLNFLIIQLSSFIRIIICTWDWRSTEIIAVRRPIPTDLRLCREREREQKFYIHFFLLTKAHGIKIMWNENMPRAKHFTVNFTAFVFSFS